MPLEILILPVLQDNYIFLLHEPRARATAVVDPAEAGPVLAALRKRGWTLDMILNTHHHGDHVGGNRELQAATGCAIVGYGPDAHRIPGITRRVEDGDTVAVGEELAHVLFVPGHTLGHIAYHFPSSRALFCGDTLFSLGCGRLFEGTPEQMRASLTRLAVLPDDTRVYCAHEYTEKNGHFALLHDPGNGALQERMREVTELRKQGKPTIPTTIGGEKAANPFLRCDLETFSRLRERRNSF